MNCASCGHETLPVMDFGRVALAGAFLKHEQFAAEKFYQLTLQFCEACLLAQVGEQIPASELFENYFYHSSATATMRAHFANYARALVERFKPSNALEIGCNDGVLLRPLRALGVEAVGVDPAGLADDLPIIRGYWPNVGLGDATRFDLILANNVYAHIEDVNAATAAIARALAARGSFVFEVNRLDSLIAEQQYDWVYHEHRYYYSLLALDSLLARHGLEVYDCEPIPTHAGSMRYFAALRGAHEIECAVIEQRLRERKLGLDRVATFLDFAALAEAHRKVLRALVKSYAGSVSGYGACGRANTMLQWCGFGQEDIAYIVDDATAKHGFYTPGTHIPIVPREWARDVEAQSCFVVFAWSFWREIEPKLAGYPGKVVIPLPGLCELRQRAAA